MLSTRYLYWVVCFLLFQIGALVKAQNTDIEILRKINIDRNQGLDGTFKGLSDSATPISLAAPLGILAASIIQKNDTLKNKGLVMGASIVSVSLITYTLKHIIKRDRPFITYSDIQKLDNAASPSFPSGHTSAAFSTATSLTLAFPKWYVIVPAYLWAGGVGYSRMHLGVHYPSDVLAGAITGAGTAMLCNYFSKKLFSKKIKRINQMNDLP